MGDYEAAFSDDDEEEEGADGGEQVSTAFTSACGVTGSSVEETCKTTEMEEDFPGSTNDNKAQEYTSESTSGDSGSDSSRPLSPGPVSMQYYYFYQGTLKLLAL